MSVIHPQPPTSALQALTQALEVQREPKQLHQILTAAGQYASHPHRVYAMDVQDVEAGAGLDAARLVAWRFIVSSSGGHAAVELPCRSDDTGHHFGLVNEGPFVQGTLDALQMAHHHAAAANREYEVAALRIPALYVEALWLRAVDGHDQLVPMAPAHLVRATGTGLMSQVDFLGALRPEARRLLPLLGSSEP